ncbi:MAG: MOSC domain-containing protein [Flavobacteriales bacterium]|nr:MOSC domain-containing protein [Flavobacteriales bacterium]
MKVVSTNIAEARTVLKNGKEVKTGIYKMPAKEGIYLGKTDVKDDAVVDRKFHGGEDKACYLYSADHYPFWKEQYPDLDWHLGMFGENLTIDGLDESKIRIGATFEIGEAIIQVSEPRRPCSILGIRLNDVGLVKKFMNEPYPGIYVRVLKEGVVKSGDDLKHTNPSYGNLTIKAVYSIFSENKRNTNLMIEALCEPYLSKDCKNSIRKRLK